MRTANIVRIAAWHLALYFFIILYIIIGSYIFYLLEGEIEVIRHQNHKKSLALFKQTLIERIANRTVSFRC
jgi:hypothetical protein